MTTRKVLLAGGPDKLCNEGNIREVEDLSEKVKVAYGAGYEHFIHQGEFEVRGGEQVPVFRWCARTSIAE